MARPAGLVFVQACNAFRRLAGAPVASIVMVQKGPPDRTTVASNRRARANYDILDTYECGIVLKGSEVKSLRNGAVQLADAYARVRSNEMWIMGLSISPWSHASAQNGHIVDRPRKLLLHRNEIDRLRAQTEQEPLQLIPLSIYFREGRAKLELAVAKGRRQYDKRQAIRKRESDLEARRALSYRNR
jgi:SsrA-binding protein